MKEKDQNYTIIYLLDRQKKKMSRTSIRIDIMFNWWWQLYSNWWVIN